MTSMDWSDRAQAYVDSDAHREGDDLEQLVAWAAGATTALDVADGRLTLDKIAIRAARG